MATADREAWDRQPGESSWDFARFCRYRDLGPSRSIPEAVRSWLSEPGAKTSQQRRFRTVEDPDEYVRRVSWSWEQVSRKQNWVERVRAFDEAVEEEARGRAVEEHVEEEAEQLRLRLVAARTLRSTGLAVWERFSTLVDEGKLDEMVLQKIRRVVVLTKEGGGHSRVEREVQSIVSLLGLAREAIAEGLKQERLELGEPTERNAVDLEDGRDAIDRELEAMGREGRASLRKQLEDFLAEREIPGA